MPEPGMRFLPSTLVTSDFVNPHSDCVLRKPANGVHAKFLTEKN